MQPFERLEVQWAEFNGLDPKGMVACSSGTAALHLALEAFRLPPGSECLVPDYTMIACPRAVTMAGLTPVFVDCDKSLVADQRLLYTSVGITTKAVMLVSVYGRRSPVWQRDTERIKVVEDLAEAHGIQPRSGTDAACWSFYKNKIVAGEEGGAVWFRDPDHAKLARQLRTLGFTDTHDYTHVPRGWNHRMSNAHAELVLQGYGETNRNGLPSYRVNVEQRQEIELWYEAECPAEWRQPKRDAVWVYDLRIPRMTVETQRRVVEELRAVGVGVRYGFKPCRRQQEYLTLDNRVGLGEWESDRASREVIYLPVAPGVTTKDDARRAFDVIRQTVGV